MVTKLQQLSDLYTTDETAWLEATARLVAEGRFAEVDAANLIEYLTSMAIRDRREVKSRLTVLLIHLLKWYYQPDKRTPSWMETVRNERLELEQLLESGTLLNHAETVFTEVYGRARAEAVRETKLDAEVFPAGCPWTFEEVLQAELS